MWSQPWRRRGAVTLRALVIGKLKRKLQADGIASKLDTFIGQSVTI
jgi:hypothetical protein